MRAAQRRLRPEPLADTLSCEPENRKTGKRTALSRHSVQSHRFLTNNEDRRNINIRASNSDHLSFFVAFKGRVMSPRQLVSATDWQGQINVRLSRSARRCPVLLFSSFWRVKIESLGISCEMSEKE